MMQSPIKRAILDDGRRPGCEIPWLSLIKSIHETVPPEWSYKLNQSLLVAGKDVKLFKYEGKGHSFIGDACLIFMNRAVTFLTPT